MKYIDLHCDSLTECVNQGKNLNENDLQAGFKKLEKGGALAQCFAVFTQCATPREAEEKVEKYLDYYAHMLDLHKKTVLSVTSGKDFSLCEKEQKLGCILTIENLGFIGTDLTKLQGLKECGVCMASLVWNEENALARPNLIFKDGVPQFKERNPQGLTALGKAASEELDRLKIIIDISHLSDGGVEDLLKNRKIPLVASHSNAEGECPVSRNLTDAQIKKIADCGGVIGVNFCKDFLCEEGGAFNAFEAVYRHISRILAVGGEDVLSLGSDFDGIPAYKELEDCTRMPALLNYLNLKGVPAGVLEKICTRNFIRVFNDVIG